MSRITDHESRITASRIWTVVPARGVIDGKSRLASALDPAARAQLNRDLLASTLEVIAAWSGLDRCAVVSPCVQTLDAAVRLGAEGIRETGATQGLNEAAALGASYASDRGARAILVLAADLPYLTPESLSAVLHAARTSSHMVIAPDKTGTGTNALLLSAEKPFEFRYGEQSFARHLLLAAERGWTAAICARAELEFDLDTPEDLAAWSRSAGGTSGPRVSR